MTKRKSKLWTIIERLVGGARSHSEANRRPPYWQYEILPDVQVEGFRYGTISNIGPLPTLSGDGFLVAPDGSQCGLIWEVTKEQILEEVAPADSNSWGVWRVGFPYPVKSSSEIEMNLRAVIHSLRDKWEAWKASREPENK